MERFFSIEGRFFRMMSKAADLLVLNLMWLVSSLPIVTIGVSTTALFQIAMEMSENKESYIIKTYWKSFRKNFKIATTTWTLFLTIQTMLIIGGIKFGERPGNEVWSIFLWMCEIFALIIYLYVIPVQAYGIEKNLWKIIKTAFIIGIVNLPWTVVLMVGELILFIITLRNVFISLPIWLFIGVAANAYMMSVIFLRGIRKTAN